MKNLLAKYDYVLFDFDGTLSQSGIGVRMSLEHAIRTLGKPMIDLSDYSKYLGPPLINTFKNICGYCDEDAQKGVEIYKEFYQKEGIKHNYLYDGVEQVLKTLKENNVPMAVCSSKFEPFLKRCCEIVDITKYFNAVCGSTKDGSRKEKKDMIPYAVESLGGKMTDKIVIVGDTFFDTKGAMETGIDFIGAEYGYGINQLMVDYGGKKFAKTPLEIIDFIL